MGYKYKKFSLQSRIRDALREDVGPGDQTSEILIPASAQGRGLILSKEAGIFSGKRFVQEAFHLTDQKLKCRLKITDGQKFSKGQTLIELRGRIRSILKAERVVLNLLGHLCGIATHTQKLTRLIKNRKVRILDTRKTTPLWRDLEKEAVRAGGGRNHRMGLYDAIFVKENHRPYGKLNALRKFRGRFEIEVRNLRELTEALALQPKVILFDNFKPSQLRRAVQLARQACPKIILEASGGITEKNIRAYAATGVDQISMGSLTHSVKAIDLSLLVIPAKAGIQDHSLKTGFPLSRE